MSQSSSITPGSIATFTVTLTPPVEDLPFDTGKITALVPPPPYKAGGYFPGMWEALVGGETSVDNVPLAESDPRMIASIGMDQLKISGLPPEEIKLGQELFLQNGMKAEIVEVGEGSITIDANPAMSRVKGIKMTLEVSEVVNGGKGSVEGTGSTWGNFEDPRFEIAVFAGGCFWGLELAYQRMKGVVATKPGYTSGRVHSPSYEAVCSGTTGHTEAVMVIFDRDVVSYRALCELLVERLGDNVYKLNQVGNDMGTQYRHGIYPVSPEQRGVAEEVLGEIPNAGEVKTEIVDATEFFDGEEYHMQYLQKGGQSAKKSASETIRCYG